MCYTGKCIYEVSCGENVGDCTVKEPPLDALCMQEWRKVIESYPCETDYNIICRLERILNN